MILQSYDLDAGALYITLADGPAARTVQLDEGTLVDLDADGRLLGIEVIQPWRAWPLEDILARFSVIEDEARQLRAYFPHPQQLRPPAHPGLRVPVAVG
jgi:uncharacterized protein YuzE